MHFFHVFCWQKIVKFEKNMKSFNLWKIEQYLFFNDKIYIISRSDAKHFQVWGQGGVENKKLSITFPLNANSILIIFRFNGLNADTSLKPLNNKQKKKKKINWILKILVCDPPVPFTVYIETTFLNETHMVFRILLSLSKYEISISTEY